MKEIFRSIVCLFLIAAFSSINTSAQNLIANADFTAGNSGFTSNYINVGNPNPFGVKGAYDIVTNPNAWFTPFSPCPDHTTGTGRMMVIDGSDVNNTKLWEQTVSVVPGKNYQFSYYVQSVTLGFPARIEILINGVSLGAAITAPATTCTWAQRNASWNSGVSSSATITVYNRELSGNGNDFALDDLSFTMCPSAPIISTPVYLCQNSPSVPLTASASVGSTLLWYTTAVGGVGSVTAPTPSTTTVGATTFYVSQTDGICESPRSGIVVNVVANTGAVVDIICRNDLSTPTTVYFDWNNVIGYLGYNYSYSIAGGPIVTGFIVAPSRLIVPVPGPGTSVTLNILSVLGLPCVAPDSQTCNSPCSAAQQIAPTFTPISPFCFGKTPVPSLPLLSIEGITGSWSPAIINNTIGDIYIFTPDPILFPCALTQTMVVTVDPLVTPAFTTIPTVVCQSAPAPTLPTSSSNVTPITGTWSPATVNTTILGSFPYTFTPNPGQCTAATPTVVSIRIDPVVTPSFAAVPAICSGGILAPLPTTSTNGIAGTWSPALNNTATITYTFTPTAGQCATTTTLTITVNPNIIPTFTPVAAICSGGVLTALPTTSLNSFTGSWSPALNNLATTTYTFIPTAGQCATTTTLTIIVNPNTTPSFNPVTAICSGGVLAALPTTSLNSFTGTWSPALNNTATTTYTFIPTAGQCATTTTMAINVNPSITPTFTPVAAICSGRALAALPNTSLNGYTGTWAPALNNTATTTYTFTPTSGQCATIITMTISVNPNITPTFTPVAAICSGGVLAALPTSSLNSFTGTWSPALNNTATTTYTFTPTAGQCATTTTMTIIVNPNITPTFTPVAAICLGGVLTTLPTTSLNGYTGTWAPALNNAGTTTYTFTPTAGQCATAATLTITVNANVIPLFAPVPSICSGAILSPLPTTSTNGISGTWTPALNNTVTTLYTFTPTAGLCATSTTLTISVNPIIAPNFAPIPNLCSGSTAPILANTSPSGIIGTWSPTIISNTTNGSYTFTPAASQCSTTQILNVTITPIVVTNFAAIPAFCSGSVAPILATISPNGVNGTWSPAIISNTVSGNYVFTPDTLECAASQTLNVVVDPIVSPDFIDLPICSGATAPILETTSPNGITGTWLPSSIDNSISGTYVFTPDAPQCAALKTINVTVNPSNTLVGISWTVSDAFSKNQIVTVTATATGNYLYQLDSGLFQTSAVFENVSSGLHSITVIDLNGCSSPITDNNVLVIGYPKFFTPNGDGENDVWNIRSLNNQLNTRIYIFDRYGKLLKDISPNDSGWDGTYIGQPMPSADYWFTVEYAEQNIIKEFKSHFSLKR